MIKKPNGRMPEQFVPITRSAHTRLRALSVNALRFVLFLMEEHLSHGGQENGRLHAPYRQLVAAGITMRLIRPSIEEAEAAGLVEAYRAGMRTATLYKLVWLPVHDHHMAPPPRSKNKGKIQKSASQSGSR